MRHVRCVTAIAVGGLACETLADEIAADGISRTAGRHSAGRSGQPSRGPVPYSALGVTVRPELSYR
jgi:hypothetical protein